MLEITEDHVVAAVSRTPRSIADVGVELASAQGATMSRNEGQPVGEWLAAAGISLSAIQTLVDVLVTEGRVQQVRGRDLWDLGLPTTGTKAQSRYYLSPS